MDKSTVLRNCLVKASKREAMLTAGPMRVKSSRVRDPILPYMTSTEIYWCARSASAVAVPMYFDWK